MKNNIYVNIEIDDSEIIEKVNKIFRDKINNIDIMKNNTMTEEIEVDFSTLTL